MLWIQGLTVMLLVKRRGEISFMPAVTAVLLHQNAMDTGTGSSIVSTGKRGYGVYACSYCSSVTSHFFGYSD